MSQWALANLSKYQHALQRSKDIMQRRGSAQTHNMTVQQEGLQGVPVVCKHMWCFLNGQALCFWVERCHYYRHDQDHASKEYEDAPLKHAQHGQICLRPGNTVVRDSTCSNFE